MLMKILDVKKDGLPYMDKLTGRVAFIFDGCIVSGWPLENGNWEANEDVGRFGEFSGVEKYIVFDKEIWNL